MYVDTHLPVNCRTSAVLDYQLATERQMEKGGHAVIKAIYTCIEKLCIYF